MYLCAQSKIQDIQMQPENVYYQCNTNHNYHVGICSLQDKRLEESPCLDSKDKIIAGREKTHKIAPYKAYVQIKN